MDAAGGVPVDITVHEAAEGSGVAVQTANHSLHYMACNANTAHYLARPTFCVQLRCSFSKLRKTGRLDARLSTP